MSGGGGSSTNTVTEKADPWKGVQPYLKDIYANAQGLFNKPQPFYPERTFPFFNQSQLSGMQSQLGYANDVYAPATQQYQNFLQGMMQAPDTVASNPAVMNMINAQGSLINDQLTRNWLPQIRSGAIGAGQYGGSRQGIAEGLAMGEASKALANSAAQTQLGAYEQAVRQQLGASSVYPGALQMGFTPGSMLQGFGSTLQGMDQQSISENAARFGWPYTEPWNRLNQYVGAVGGIPVGQYGTTTQTSSGGGSSSALGGALNGAMMGASLATPLAMMGGPLANGIAGLGAPFAGALGFGGAFALPLMLAGGLLGGFM